jgi:hypothetical protein
MKKFRLFAGSLLLAGALFGCIENEEAEGVKALREAQAALINAKAVNETTLANAEAAYQAALAKIEEARAKNKELQNELTEGKNEVDLELYRVTKGGEIEAAKIEAEELLNNAKTALEASIRALKAEIAVSNASTPELDEYLAKYTDAVGKVTSLQGEIIDKNIEIAVAEYYNSDDDLMNLKKTTQDRLTRELALIKEWKERYEAVVGERIGREQALLEVNELLHNLEYNLYVKETQLEEQGYLNQKAYSEYDRAYTQYSTASNALSLIENFTNGVGSYSIPNSFLETVIDEPIPYSGSQLFRSTTAYEALILPIEEDLSGYSSVLKKVEALKRIYANKLAQLEAAIPPAEALITTREHELNLAILKNEADPTTANQSAEDAAQTAYDNAIDAYNAAVDAYAVFKSTIDTSNLNGVDQYNGTALGWINGTNNVQGIDDVIAWYMNEIADLEADLEGHEEELAIVEAYITYLNEIDVARIPDYKEAYFTARAAYWESQERMDELLSERSYIALEISYAEDFAAATEQEYSEVEDRLDDISDGIYETEAELAMIEKDFASWEAYKEKLARELSVLEDELTVYQKKADKFYALVNSELDNTGGNATVTEE